jgi:hypothetical protein
MPLPMIGNSHARKGTRKAALPLRWEIRDRSGILGVWIEQNIIVFLLKAHTVRISGINRNFYGDLPLNNPFNE